ncbi:CPSF A subunit region-domain-containing protein [Fimicolochytrium jonesii]|uniref:CPSF A subunit region-domain-containing protein n=1 Tax=Fimicolochytrium jonesii TaxID=1396493 RepID=UPI0022FDF648|nr:CPSF A subunit region-domain-containing protein [Fimicolochytrium jonesii]KAI8824396.1 CPSF A subunit region-domain-containing protein [Fimicolochytrium jonesii]
MFLYNLTLQQPTAITQATLGNFSGTKQQEILVARNSVLELLRPDSDTGKVHSLLTHQVFGIIRSIAPFRLTGASKDYIVVGSDSGKIVILEYNPEKNVFDRVHEETFGKSGCRRIVPGQYLAADPKGRAVMIGAIEKQKLVYILNRDASTKLTISSPLEAHKSHTLVHDIVGVDVGFENPVFACIEVDYADADQDPLGEAFQNAEKVLTYYELDLGLNHVVRKWSDPIDTRSNKLIAVPGGVDGPSGVLVCTEDYITWKHQDHPAVRVPIPRRPDPLNPMPTNNGEDFDTGRGVIIVSSVMHKLKKGFFIWAQTEDGDIFKITMDYSAGADGAIGGVQNLKIKYLDTIPVATSMCLLKSGFLFVASEFGNHYLYQIVNLGDDDEQTEYQSAELPQGEDAEDVLVYFNPRPLLNLAMIDEMESISPLIDAKVLNLAGDDSPQIYALSGRGARSSFRTLRHGLEVSEMAVSELPGHPNAVWTVKANSQEQFDSFIIVSFVDATLVLSIGETVEEVTDTGFLNSTPTLTVAQLGDDALVQVYPRGIRHIRADRRVSEWKTPGNKAIVRAACNQRQVVIALSGGELVYFELDRSGQLNEYQDRKEFAAPITALSIGPIPEGRQRSSFLAVGCEDNTVRVISLDPDSCLQSMGVQAVTYTPVSLTIVQMMDTGTPVGTLYLLIGLQAGLLVRTTLDSITGTLSDTRLRLLGSRPVKLFNVTIQGSPAVLALSSRPWLSYTFQGRSKLIPLSFPMLEYGSSFCSEQCAEGIVAIESNNLHIITVEKLGNVFNHSVLPLKYTPRRFVLHQPSNNFAIIESEHNTWCPSEKTKKLEEKANSMDEGDGLVLEELPPDQFGLPRAEPGKWTSCIRVVNPRENETTHLIELDDNEAAFSITTCIFNGQNGETLLVVGTASNVTMSPRTCTSGQLHTYRFSQDGSSLELLHKTPIDEIPQSLCAFQGRLLVGMGRTLRVYDLGKKKLLRKCENKQFPNNILTIHTQGDRIVVGDVQESVLYASYRHFDNRIVIFADDTTPRWITTTTMLDYDTVAGGDKFGNLFVARLPAETSEEVDDDPTGNKLVYEKGYLQGAPHKLEHTAEFFIGETPTAISKTVLVPGGREIIVYITLMGTIGCAIPFQSKEDVDFFQTLEMHMRAKAPPLCGRDHLAYRSFYIPVRNVVDGDLCEHFNLLPATAKREIAEELDREVHEIAKKLEDVRNRVAF